MLNNYITTSSKVNLIAIVIILSSILATTLFAFIFFSKFFKIKNKTTNNNAKNAFYLDDLETPLEFINNGLIAIDTKGSVSFLNQIAQNLTGFSRDESVGRDFLNIFNVYDAENIKDELSKKCIMKDNNTFEAILVSKCKDHVPISVSVNMVNDKHNILLGFVIVFSKNNDTKASNISCDSESCGQNYYNIDSLTQVYNRKYFYEYLNNALEKASATTTQLAVLFIDLDLFKNINDTLGHDIGDLLLIESAARLVNCLGNENKNVARMGGDEFAILLDNFSDKEDVKEISNKILSTLSSPFIINNYDLLVSASIGISIYPEHGEETHELLKNAASSMYKAKESGRNSFQLYSPEINENTLRRFTMHKNLRRALINDELVLHYQPKVDGKSGELVGIEALVRWQHPQRGLIYPAEFIPLAEETGLIKQIDEWVLNTACLQLRKWINEGQKPLRLAVNLSAWQFKEQHLADTVASVLKNTGVHPNDLELEITETAAMENLNFTVNTLGKLMVMGVNISIDDFGTGYSSLNYLKHFPINFLKIDRSFVSDILEDKNTCAIVKAIIDVAHTLNLKVIAEGVETQDQLTLLKQLDCDEIQGFFISRPLSVAQIEKHMKKI